jgi:hypothetical protein
MPSYKPCAKHVSFAKSLLSASQHPTKRGTHQTSESRQQHCTHVRCACACLACAGARRCKTHCSKVTPAGCTFANCDSEPRQHVHAIPGPSIGACLHHVNIATTNCHKSDRGPRLLLLKWYISPQLSHPTSLAQLCGLSVADLSPKKHPACKLPSPLQVLQPG